MFSCSILGEVAIADGLLLSFLHTDMFKISSASAGATGHDILTLIVTATMGETPRLHQETEKAAFHERAHIPRREGKFQLQKWYKEVGFAYKF